MLPGFLDASYEQARGGSHWRNVPWAVDMYRVKMAVLSIDTAQLCGRPESRTGTGRNLSVEDFDCEARGAQELRLPA